MVFLPLPAQAYFFDYGAGVRPAGMGQAFVAVADDANTINWNSAGLADVEAYEITTMYASLFSGFGGRLYTGVKDSLGYNFMAAALPISPEIGYFGFSWSQFYSYFYRENTLNLGYARTFSYESEIFRVGVNLKMLNWSVDANAYTAQESKAGFTLDLGALYEFSPGLTAGLSLENLLPSNMGVTTYEEVPRNVRLGMAWRRSFTQPGLMVDDLLLSGEYDNRSYAQNINTFRLGAESWFWQGLAAVRLGVNSTEFTVGLSGKYAFPQLNGTEIQVDYAFALPFYVQKTYGSHRISLGARWGKMPTAQPTPVAEILPPEENLAAKRDAELAAEREKEQAKLKAMMDQLRLEIQAARTALNRVNELIKLGKLPTIQFQSGKAMLTRKSFESLDQIGSILAKFPQIKVRLEGHTDSTGSEKVNQRLSQNRVEAVKEYLAGKYKLVPSNLIPVGYGETRPIASNTTPEGRAVNRRVEVVVLVPAGMDVGGADGKDLGADAGENLQEQINPDDIVKYEDVEKLRERLNIYKMQMNQGEVEEMFNQQHQPESK